MKRKIMEKGEKRVAEKIEALFFALVLSICFLTGASAMDATHAKAEEMTDEEVCQAAKELFDQCMEYAASDPDKFASLYRGTAAETIQDDMNFFQELYSEHYAKDCYVLVAQEGPYYMMQQCHYTVAGTHPNTHFSASSGTFAMSYLDSEWKMDFSEDALNAINTTEIFTSVYPEGMMEANNAGRNASIFGNYPYLYLDDTAVFEGVFDTQLAYLWQNEDGSVDAVVGLANGTEGAIYVNSITLTITDDSLGTILDQVVSCGEMINAGYNKAITLHFEPEQVLTGTATWTNMQCQAQSSF